jgi:predicted DNA-binding transcriptional regulator YafY
MNFYEHRAMLSRIDALIKRKGTGTPQQLSSRLQATLRTTYRYLDEIRTCYDAPLCYCRKRQTYYYEDENFILKI